MSRDQKFDPSPRDPRRDLTAVVAAIDGGQIEEAARLYRLVVADSGGWRADDLSPGEALLRGGLAGEALDFVTLRTNVDGPEADGLRGRSLSALGRPGEAEPFLRASMAPERVFLESRENQEALAEVCERLGKDDEAAFRRRRSRIMAENFRTPSNESYDRAFSLKPKTRNPLRERARLWPPAFGANGELFLPRENLREIIERYVIADLPRPARRVHADDRIFSFGSCFARNIAAALLDFNVVPFNATFFEDINTPVANQLFFEWLAGGQKDDPNIRRVEILYGPHRDWVIKNLAEADALIMTVGVGVVPFDLDTGRFVFAPIFEDGTFHRIGMRTMSVAEHSACIKAIIGHIRVLNPTAPIYMTLSPIPLKGTIEFPSVIVADCLSKSTLRVALAEVLNEVNDNIFYWPAFEIIRWLGAHMDFPLFNNMDTRHPDRSVIREITDLFVKTFGDDTLTKLCPADDH